MNEPVDQRWADARERMRRHLDVYFEGEIGDDGRASHVDNILERIVKEEFLGLLRGTWTVWRQDDNGNSFQVESRLSYEAAQTLTAELEARGHKQYYWFRPSDA